MTNALDRLRKISYETKYAYTARPVHAHQKAFFSKIVLTAFILISIVGVISVLTVTLPRITPANYDWIFEKFFGVVIILGVTACIFNIMEKGELLKVEEFYKDVDLLVEYLQDHSSTSLNEKELAIRLLTTDYVECTELGEEVYLKLRRNNSGTTLVNIKLQ